MEADSRFFDFFKFGTQQSVGVADYYIAHYAHPVSLLFLQIPSVFDQTKA